VLPHNPDPFILLRQLHYSSLYTSAFLEERSEGTSVLLPNVLDDDRATRLVERVIVEPPFSKRDQILCSTLSQTRSDLFLNVPALLLKWSMGSCHIYDQRSEVWPTSFAAEAHHGVLCG
jgi:hypothetical protein